MPAIQIKNLSCPNPYNQGHINEAAAECWYRFEKAMISRGELRKIRAEQHTKLYVETYERRSFEAEVRFAAECKRLTDLLYRQDYRGGEVVNCDGILISVGTLGKPSFPLGRIGLAPKPSFAPADDMDLLGESAFHYAQAAQYSSR